MRVVGVRAEPGGRVAVSGPRVCCCVFSAWGQRHICVLGLVRVRPCAEDLASGAGCQRGKEGATRGAMRWGFLVIEKGRWPFCG